MRNPFDSWRALRSGKAGGGGDPGGIIRPSDVAHYMGGSGLPPYDPRFTALATASVSHWSGIQSQIEEEPLVGRFFKDVAGLEPATQPGDPIALIKAASGSFNFTQPVLANRPRLGRHPLSGYNNHAIGAQATGDNNFWAASGVSNGLTYTRVNSGTLNGVPFADIRIQGTATDPLHNIGWTPSNSTIQIPQGLITSARVSAQVVGGTPPSGSASAGIRLILQEQDQALANIGVTSRSAALNGVAAAETTLMKVGNTTGVAYMRLGLICETGATEEVDVTYRVWGLQFCTGALPANLTHSYSALDLYEPNQPDVYFANFDGVDDFMISPSLPWSTDELHALFVYSTRDSKDNRCLLEYSNSTDSNNGSFFIFNNALVAGMRVRSKGTSVANAGSSSFFTQHSTTLLEAQAKISSDWLGLYSNQVQRASSSEDQGSGPYGNHPFYLGARGGTSYFFAGRLYDMLLLNRLISDSDRNRVYEWLRRTYNIAA